MTILICPDGFLVVMTTKRRQNWPTLPGWGLRLRVKWACDNFNNCPGFRKGAGKYCAWLDLLPPAGVAQSVEHLICNQRVGGSIPFASSRKQDSGNRKRFARRRVLAALL